MLDSATMRDFGGTGRVSATKDETTIVEGRGSEDAIQARINQIKTQIEETTSEFDLERHQGRLASLSGGRAVIRKGAATGSNRRCECLLGGAVMRCAGRWRYGTGAPNSWRFRECR